MPVTQMTMCRRCYGRGCLHCDQRGVRELTAQELEQIETLPPPRPMRADTNS